MRYQLTATHNSIMERTKAPPRWSMDEGGGDAQARDPGILLTIYGDQSLTASPQA
jgi:hypothetical protein